MFKRPDFLVLNVVMAVAVLAVLAMVTTDRRTAVHGSAGSPAIWSSPLPDAVLARIPRFAAPPPPQRSLAAGRTVPGVYRTVPTEQPVAFLTIDDGWVKNPAAVQLLRAARIPVTLFLTTNAVRDDPGFFRALQGAGAVIEAHTLDHPHLAGMPYERQKQQICGSADELGRMFGRRPVLFRPPYGSMDSNTSKAIRDCGMKATALWRSAVDGGVVRYASGERLTRGDIIVMHFRQSFTADFMAALRAIHDAGLTPARLEDYVG